ncbi:NYN domain-containing protein [Nocardioides daejeonensis]|uniref:NYN domain-containing protein n=1 Tax=Nocardioides daejeonensis TaxID=1046556 RepID=UPI000D74088B|nr:NYN domain-containing protein [Nocardioides daejeonensis]
MRSTCSLYIDAGYLLAAAATRVTGTSLRSGIHTDFARLTGALIAHAEARSGLPVLRVHWYDSAHKGVPDAQQERIGELPKVKLRLGRFGVDGQQKGVDLRIGLDLVAHARNAASDVFFVVTGDDDLTEAVEEAQVQGVEVVLLALPTIDGKPHGVSRHLIRAADDLDQLDGDAIDAAVVKVEVPRPVPGPPPTRPAPVSAVQQETGAKVGPTPRDLAAVPRPAVAAVPVAGASLAYTGSTGQGSRVLPGYDLEVDEPMIDRVVDRVVVSLRHSVSREELTELDRNRPSIPREIDRALLVDLSDELGLYDLNDATRYRLRSRFWERYDEG